MQPAFVVLVIPIFASLKPCPGRVCARCTGPSSDDPFTCARNRQIHAARPFYPNESQEIRVASVARHWGAAETVRFDSSRWVRT